VPRVELAPAAVEDLADLIDSHELPGDTWPRVVRSLRSLEHFPLSGRALDAPWSGYRFVLGPWRWMLLVYEYLEAEDRIVVVTIQDGRTSTSPTSGA
jgi:plasmid stabilization system protein ParE